MLGVDQCEVSEQGGSEWYFQGFCVVFVVWYLCYDDYMLGIDDGVEFCYDYDVYVEVWFYEDELRSCCVGQCGSKYLLCLLEVLLVIFVCV